MVPVGTRTGLTVGCRCGRARRRQTTAANVIVSAGDRLAHGFGGRPGVIWQDEDRFLERRATWSYRSASRPHWRDMEYWPRDWRRCSQYFAPNGTDATMKRRGISRTYPPR